MGGKTVTQVDNTVRAALSGRAPICLNPEQTVREAAAILSKHEIGAAPVLAGDRLVGMFSERDILRRVVADGRDAATMRVADAMTHDPRTVSTATSLVEALALMIEGNFRHLPVVDGDGRVIAMLSMRDIPPVNQLMHFQWTTWTRGEAGSATQGPTSGRLLQSQFRDTRLRPKM
jgi:CBS domain-containing protein